MSNFDVIVIGTGAGGASAIHQLTTKGLRVLALERGPWLDQNDFKEGGVFGHSFPSRGRGDELKTIRNHYLMPNVKKQVRFLSYSTVDPVPKPVHTNNGWQSQLVGGGTVHYGGASFRAEEVDFRMRTTFGKQSIDGITDDHQANLQDWPIDLKEMENWYSVAEKQIGISASPGCEMPPLKFNKAAKLLQERVKSAKISPTPMAINSKIYNDRGSCRHSGLCQDFACRFEAKSDMRVTLLRQAEETKLLTIQPNTIVTRIISKNNKVTGVQCIVENPDGKKTERTYQAEKYVIACEMIETIRLLKISNIGNQNILGHYVMFHVTGGARSVATEETTTWDTAPHTAYFNDYYYPKERGDFAKPFLKAGILLVTSASGPLGEMIYTPRWGEKAEIYFREVYPFKMDLSYIGEGLPTFFNRIELSSEKDEYGMNGTVLFQRPHPYDLNAGLFVREKALQILEEAGSTTIANAESKGKNHLVDYLKKSTDSSRLFHGAGGCRMGEDPKTSYTDSSCRVHGIDNLYVADASVFPTGLGNNPTLTIQANAMRVGHLIASGN